MFKKISLLLLLSPLTNSFAQQTISEQTENENNKTNIINNFVSLNKPQKNSARNRDAFFRQCYINVPAQVISTETRPMEEIPVNIDALSMTGSNSQFIYQDEVHLKQGEKHLSADKMTYLIAQDKALAEGNVSFVNGDVTLYSDTIEAYLSTQESTLLQADYQFHGQGGRGSAERIYNNGADLYELNTSTYTACPPNDTTWSLDASTLYINNAEDVGSAYNAILRIKDVPVFYLPYITYPLSDKRKTGLLFPTFKYSDTNGFSFSQSLYINITANMDATITSDYMQNRGTKIAGEYRYLFAIGQGSLQAEYLGDDRIRNEERYLLHWDHHIDFAQNWTFNAEYSRVSDEHYFSDLDTPYGNRSDNQLLQTAKLSYRQETWNSELEVRSFQVLSGDDDDDATPHKVLPKLSFSAYKPLNWKSLQLDLYSEITKFDHSDDNVYSGTRIHIEPKLSLPLYYNAIFINTELKYMLSLYQQSLPDNGEKDWYDDLEKSTSRYLPSFKINSGVNFERKFSLGSAQYRQTLVPQIQYLYVPYQDQSAIGTYDTTSLQQDYYGLFRDNRYSGFDRIADANQITIGVSSSFLNSHGKERLRIAIGQNYYIEASKVHLPSDNYNDDESDAAASRSSIIGEFDMNFNNDYFFHTGLNWDSDNNLMKRANATLEKRWLYNTFAQISFRYLAFSEDSELSIDEDEIVNQLGSKMSWSINNQWSAFASYYHDLEYNQPFESIVGIQYQSCCWAIGLTYDQHMLAYYGDLDDINERSETEQSLQLNIELIGLGGVGFSAGDQGIFDYGSPFYLQ